MKLQTIKSFKAPGSSRPIFAGELLDISEGLARQWIADGLAIEFAGGNAKAAEEEFHLPAKAPGARHRNRETAVSTS
jgi:hypothetical protein